MEKLYQSENEFYEDRLFLINKRFLEALGRWPYQPKRTRILIFCLFTIGLSTVVLAELIYFVKVIKLKDIPKIIDCIPALIFTYGTLVMMLNSIITFDEMLEILEKMKENWLGIKEQKEYEVFQEYAEEGRLLIVVYLICLTTTITTFSVAPLMPKILDMIIPLNESRPIKTLLEVEYLVDHDKYYTLIYVHNLQAAFWVIVTVFTMDAYFIMIIQHACSMFVVLGCRIDRIGRGSKKVQVAMLQRDYEATVTDEIINCIKYHENCIKFADLIESSFTISLFLQLFLNMVVISVTLVQTISRSDNPEDLLKFLFNTMSVIFRLFYVSWPGQKMTNHSLQVRELVCNVGWYELPTRSRKFLILMILRSTKACNITAGGMFPMNFETYCTLMQTSMSYFTMILSTQ